MEKQTKQQAIEEFEKFQEKQFKQGKVIVNIIVFVNIAVAVISLFTNFRLGSFILDIAISVLLLMGYSWVKYVTGISQGLGAFVAFIALFSLLSNFDIKEILVTIILALLTAYKATSCVLLLFNKGVADYLYYKRYG